MYCAEHTVPSYSSYKQNNASSPNSLATLPSSLIIPPSQSLAVSKSFAPNLTSTKPARTCAAVQVTSWFGFEEEEEEFESAVFDDDDDDDGDDGDDCDGEDQFRPPMRGCEVNLCMRNEARESKRGP